MIDLKDTLKSIIPALLVSAVVTVTGSITTQKVDSRLLEDNIKATQELSKAVQDLRYLMGVFSERYVTRDELDNKLGFNRSKPHGT